MMSPSADGRALRIVAGISRPLTLKGQPVPPLDNALEPDALRAALTKAKANAEVTFLHGITPQALREALPSCHVLYFDGHGQEEDGSLLFETEHGEGHLIPPALLARILKEQGVQLIVMSACHSARCVPALRQAGVLAVLAMRESVRQDEAATFAGGFFRVLAQGQSLADAYEEGKLSVALMSTAKPKDEDIPMLDAENAAVTLTKPGAQLAEPVFVTNTTTVHNLPTDEKLFVGRSRELVALNKALADNRVVVLHGDGGIGKSALAREAARWHRDRGRFPGGIVWIDLTAGGTVETVLATIGETLLGQSSHQMPPDEKAQAVQNHLKQRPTLLLFDNFETAAQDANMLKFVAGMPSPSKALLTTREAVTIGRVHDLPPMHPEEAVQLFIRLAFNAGWDGAGEEWKKDDSGVFVPQKWVPRICDQVGFLPLAIELLAPQAALVPLATLSIQIQQSLDAVARDDPLLPERHRSARASLDLSFSRLSDDAKRLFARLSVFAGGAAGYSIEAVCDLPNWTQPVSELVRLGLVRFEGQRYTLHPLVRQYAREKLEAGERETYERKFAEFFLKLAQFANEKLTTDEAAAGVQLFATELPNVLSGMDWCRALEEWEPVTDYAYALTRCLDLFGLWDECERRMMQGVEAARKLDNREGEAVFLHNVGIVHQNRGDYTAARSYYEQSLKIEQELGNRAGIASSLHQLGILAQRQGDYTAARSYYEQSLAIKQELGNRAGIASSLHQLGRLAQDQGDYTAARRYYEQSLAIKQELGDRTGIAQTLHQLGILAQLQDDYTAARKLYERSLAINQELGDRAGIASSLHQLGVLAQIQGDYAAARSCYEQSLAIKQELSNRAGIASSLGQLGRLAYAEKDYVTAVRHWTVALGLFEELGAPERAIALRDIAGLREELGEEGFNAVLAEALPAVVMEEITKDLGVLAQEHGDYVRAWRLCEKTLGIYSSLGDKAGIAQTLHQMAILARLQGEYDRALQHEQEALDHLRQIGDVYQQAEVMLHIGGIYQEMGNYETAWLHYADAYRLFKQAGDELGMARTSEAVGSLEFYARMLDQAVKDLAEAAERYRNAGKETEACRAEQTLTAAREALSASVNR